MNAYLGTDLVSQCSKLATKHKSEIYGFLDYNLCFYGNLWTPIEQYVQVPEKYCDKICGNSVVTSGTYLTDGTAD